MKVSQTDAVIQTYSIISCQFGHRKCIMSPSWHGPSYLYWAIMWSIIMCPLDFRTKSNSKQKGEPKLKYDAFFFLLHPDDIDDQRMNSLSHVHLKKKKKIAGQGQPAKAILVRRTKPSFILFKWFCKINNKSLHIFFWKQPLEKKNWQKISYPTGIERRPISLKVQTTGLRSAFVLVVAVEEDETAPN